MTKTTLQFKTISDIANYSRKLQCGYLLNTVNLTLTTTITEQDIIQASVLFNAKKIEISDKVFSYFDASYV